MPIQIMPCPDSLHDLARKCSISSISQRLPLILSPSIFTPANASLGGFCIHFTCLEDKNRCSSSIGLKFTCAASRRRRSFWGHEIPSTTWKTQHDMISPWWSPTPQQKRLILGELYILGMPLAFEETKMNGTHFQCSTISGYHHDPVHMIMLPSKEDFCMCQSRKNTLNRRGTDHHV